MDAATHELSLDAPAFHNSDADATPDIEIACDILDSIPQEAHRERDFQRPAWLSPEIVAWIIGALDFCLALAAAAAFAVYSGVMDQTVAEPGRLAATLFAGVFERLGGYRLKQLARLRWQLTRSSATWAVTVSVLLSVAFLSKTSEIYSRGWVLAWIITAPVLLRRQRQD